MSGPLPDSGASDTGTVFATRVHAHEGSARGCAVPGCDRELPTGALFCAAHGAATPQELREKLCSAWAAYKAALPGGPRARAWTYWRATVRAAGDWHRNRARQGGT